MDLKCWQKMIISPFLKHLSFTDPYGFHPKAATGSFAALTPTAEEVLHPSHQ